MMKNFLTSINAIIDIFRQTASQLHFGFWRQSYNNLDNTQKQCAFFRQNAQTFEQVHIGFFSWLYDWINVYPSVSAYILAFPEAELQLAKIWKKCLICVRNCTYNICTTFCTIFLFLAYVKVIFLRLFWEKDNWHVLYEWKKNI